MDSVSMPEMYDDCVATAALEDLVLSPLDRELLATLIIVCCAPSKCSTRWSLVRA